jgi:hypothetical protein
VGWFDDFLAVEKNPVKLMWGALPPNVRDAYSSGARSLATLAGELSPGAAFRDAGAEYVNMMDAAREGSWMDAAAGPAKMATAMAGIVPISKGAKAIRGYHGSPHDYAAERLVKLPSGQTDYIVGAPNKLPTVPQGASVVQDFPLGRMRTDKIGTGEGAQVQGHGLFVAERPGVAQSYRDDLSGVPEIKRFDLGSMVLGPHNNFDYTRNASRSRRDNIHSTLAEDLLINQSDLVGAPDKQAFALAKLDNLIERYRTEWPEGVADAMALRERLARPGAVSLNMGPQPGKMYEVDIHADPARFLNWDKPIAGQDANVVKAVKEMGGSPRMTGEQFMESVSGQPAMTASTLQSFGVPGVRYLDQLSRQAGEGTRNTVVFDPSIIEIMRKYGLLPATVAAGVGGASMLPTDNAPQGGLF